MGIDRDWVVINALVEAGLRDSAILETPPMTDEELGFISATITDHLAAALEPGDLAKRSKWWQGKAPN